MRIKNWEEFQHYKDRDPKWIKLYKRILDDHQWHTLDPQSAKILVMLWLLASEMNGELPPVTEIAFRLRLPEKLIISTVTKLSHWLEQVASNALAEPDQLDSLELELELEKEREGDTDQVCTKPSPSLTDEEWVSGLERNQTYSGILVRVELGKCRAWCEANRKVFSRRRFINWLNRVERPMQSGGANRPTRVAL